MSLSAIDHSKLLAEAALRRLLRVLGEDTLTFERHEITLRIRLRDYVCA